LIIREKDMNQIGRERKRDREREKKRTYLAPGRIRHDMVRQCSHGRVNCKPKEGASITPATPPQQQPLVAPGLVAQVACARLHPRATRAAVQVTKP
jgi:hypothetical protein